MGSGKYDKNQLKVRLLMPKDKGSIDDIVLLSEKRHQNIWEHNELAKLFNNKFNHVLVVYTPEKSLAGFVVFTHHPQHESYVVSDFQIDPAEQKKSYSSFKFGKGKDAPVMEFESPKSPGYMLMTALMSQKEENHTIDFSAIVGDKALAGILEDWKFDTNVISSQQEDIAPDEPTSKWRSRASDPAFNKPSQPPTPRDIGDPQADLRKRILAAHNKLTRITGVEWEIKQKKISELADKKTMPLDLKHLVFVTRAELENKTVAHLELMRHIGQYDASSLNNIKKYRNRCIIPATVIDKILATDMPKGSLKNAFTPLLGKEEEPLPTHEEIIADYEETPFIGPRRKPPER
jgi:hypothetical protein